MKGVLKQLLDALEQSEREIIAGLGVRYDERRRAARRREDERWNWVARHSAGTVFRGITKADIELGRDA